MNESYSLDGTRLFLERSAAATIAKNRLTVIATVSLILNLGQFAFNWMMHLEVKEIKPLIIRIDEAGAAQALNYSQFDYKPQDRELRYFLIHFVTNFYSRIPATVKEKYSESLYFLERSLAASVAEQERKTNEIANFARESSEDIDIEVKNVALQDLRSSPMRAAVTFEKIYSSRSDHRELRREPYPPTSRIVMNRSLNLAQQLAEAANSARHNSVLSYFNQYRRSDADRDKQLFTALSWYNRANSEEVDDQSSIMYLSIAFESLLNLPGQDNVTRRFTEAVTLLLGRLPRLESWANQFYTARSEVVHKGRTERLRFLAADSHQSAGPKDAYKPLTAYGRQIFQLCVATIIHGAKLAEGAKLAKQLSTNTQRFERICRTLDQPGAAIDLIAMIEDDVADIREYRYQSEPALTYELIIGASRRIVCKYLLAGKVEPDSLAKAMEALCNGGTEFEKLDAVRLIYDELKLHPGRADEPSRRILYLFIDAVWHFTFMYYFQLQRQLKAAESDSAEA